MADDAAARNVAMESNLIGPLPPQISPQPSRQCLTWNRIEQSPNIPPPRSGAASIVVKGKLYVFGGYGGGTGRLDDFYSYDLENNEWQEVQVLSEYRPGCRENNGVVISDSSSEIYLFGGYGSYSRSCRVVAIRLRLSLNLRKLFQQSIFQVQRKQLAQRFVEIRYRNQVLDLHPRIVGSVSSRRHGRCDRRCGSRAQSAAGQGENSLPSIRVRIGRASWKIHSLWWL